MTSSTTPSSETQSSDLPELSAPQEHAILRAASQIVTSSINHQNLPNPESLLGDLARTVVHGAFVTLKRGNHLRGCCGVLGQPMHLAHALFQSAVTTAREDKRLPPISPTEMPYLHMDVTLLGPMIVVSGKVHNRPSAFQIGTHGLRIAKGNQAGLLLPSVAIEQGWSAEEFLEGVCRKAGLPENAWQQPDTELAIFEGRKIEGQLDPADWKGRELRAHDLLSPDQIGQLAVLTAENLFALHRGATPTYYASNLPDLNVAGVVLTLSTPGAEGEAAGAAQQYMKISLRPGIPLQSTLMELCQSAAPNLRNFGKSTPMRVDISILQDPALHGSLIDNELEGFQSTQRALMVSQPPRTGIVWKPNHQTEDLLNAAAKTARLRDGQASVISLAIGSTRDQLIVSSTPMPVIDQSPRPPAVAGSFYPKSDAARTELVRALFHGPQQKDKPAQPSPCLAIMLPHAGLLYSGQVAADVLRRVQLPKTALIIGPKHTPHGADWAVSPHSRWHLSASAYLDADMELSNRIVENVSMMQLDALAHRQEHAIEVELPLLHFLNPEIRIAAIAMHGATWKELARAASQLANVISQLDEPPLLVISSDMNHFENDQETRRRDRLALDAIQQRDPEELLTRCKQHQISMCGQLPAALVMQTLLELGAPFRVEEVQYDTSARVSRDSSRVVGYAGLIFHSSIPSSPKS